MADAVVHVLPEGIGQEQYDATNEKLNAQGDPPQGLRFHAAGLGEDGRWRIVEVWDSRADFDRFNEERLTPAISNKSSQLYMATIAVGADGSVRTYPAIYLWNQNTVVDAAGNPTPLVTSNLTPAWDDFSIPEVPPVIQVPR